MWSAGKGVSSLPLAASQTSALPLFPPLLITSLESLVNATAEVGLTVFVAQICFRRFTSQSLRPTPSSTPKAAASSLPSGEKAME